jgi:hypothetical protein
MIAKIAAEGLTLTAESELEDSALANLYRTGHVHLVCKALKCPPSHPRTTLLLTASVISWKRPKQGALR